ncbi:transglutaminase-like domain-containing protein [Planctobacterium marinum]|uniref:transglutaminase-like domain-containing protein n=1 Tax=Planctobacterium marinum TaxID=1631968 RepID=UPI001E4E637A|nr:transglutaminase domain-containing protein [Planctobacterium marinum]MCC2605377.1 hypothetical protein [Planctobacterium marinum]
MKIHIACTRKIRATVGVMALMSLLCAFANASQTYFHKEETPNKVHLKYRWQDFFGTHRSLSFELDKAQIATQNKQNKSYRPEIAQRYVYMELQRKAQTINPKEARVKFRSRNNELQIEVKSRSEQMIEKWTTELVAEREAAFDRYLAMNYYSRYVSPYGQTGVKPDHIRFVNEAVTALLPASQALYELMDDDSTSRAYVNMILSWVQSIPYNDLQDRMTSNGAGYLPPSEVLLTNKGDCDSKATLTAALLRSLLPNLHMTIVYLPNHALLGANLPHFDGEEKVTEGGIDYLLLDPTGPQLMKVGEVSDETARYINNDMFKVEKLPGQIN